MGEYIFVRTAHYYWRYRPAYSEQLIRDPLIRPLTMSPMPSRKNDQPRRKPPRESSDSQSDERVTMKSWRGVNT
jgi:hypothetical protein